MKAGAKRRKKSVQRRREGKTFDYPITETIAWVREGERLLRKWGAIKSPRAKRVTAKFSKLLGMLETLNALRKM